MSDDSDLGAGLTCFVIGPIGNRLDPLGTDGRTRYENATQMWEYVFEPACMTLGLRPVRADKISEPGEIPDQIFALIRDSDVVIADLTGGNANVMYELGLRHTRDKFTVQIGEYERLPFDVNTIRTVQFRRTEAGLIEARESLIEALRAALQGRGTPVTATRVWNELEPVGPEVLAAAAARSLEADDDDQVADAPGIVDLLAEGEGALTRLVEILGEITTWLDALGGISQSVVGRIEESDNKAGGFAGRLTVAKSMANELKEPASRLDNLSLEYVDAVNSIDAMVRLIVSQVGESPAEADEEVLEFLGQVVDLSNSAEETAVSFTGAIQGTRDMRKISNLLAPVSKSIVRSMNRIMIGIASVSAWGQLAKDVPGMAEESDPSADEAH